MKCCREQRTEDREQRAAGSPTDALRFTTTVDRTLLRENLRKTPEQRIREMRDLIAFGNEAERAVRAEVSES